MENKGKDEHEVNDARAKQGNHPNFVSLFKYQIKNRERFLDQDHPTDLPPESAEYAEYWGARFPGYIEGVWVDDEGTAVFLPPKLNFYVNYLKIEDDDRNPISPLLRDVEWIAASYILCVDGFSGFENDPDYTCSILVKKKSDGTIRPVDKNKIPKHAYKKDGTLKEYLDPWYYLTEYYLLENPRGPLGRPRYDNPRYNGVMFSGRGAGKALKPTEKVRVPNGWEEIQNLKVGDKVYGGDGRLTNVTGVFDDQPDLNFYRVTFADGRQIDACEDHQWKVFDRKKHNGKGATRGGWKTLSTKDMIAHHSKRRVDSKHRAKYGEDKYLYESRYAVPIAKSLQYENPTPVKIDPYTLGALLGDGSMVGARCSTTISSGDPELLLRVVGLNPHIELKSINGKGNHQVLNLGTSERPINQYLDSYGLLGTHSYDKFIPADYLYNTEEVRMEVLRGLMDTDGTSDWRGQIEYYTTSPQLADDVEALVRSLGIGCHRSVKPSHYKKDGKRIECRDCYRLRLFTDKQVFHLERKLTYMSHTKSKSGQSKWEKTYITNIESIGKHDGVCIRVDNEDSTFITKDYIVTHNSLWAFIMDFVHEWTFSGVRYLEDADKVNKRLLYSMAAKDSRPLSRSIKNIAAAMTRMPGAYNYPAGPDGKRPKPCMGAFYKHTQGTWSVKGETQHIVKRPDNTSLIEGSMVQSMILDVGATTVAAGDRFRRIYLEEAGFIGNLIDIYNANKDSLSLQGRPVGSFIMTGTAGDMENIAQPKRMFENPDGYNIFGIPNYWDVGAEHLKVGLFVPAYYRFGDFRDENGNIDVDAAAHHLLEYREGLSRATDSVSYASEVMFNPMHPEEMLRPSSNNVLPKLEAAEQLANIRSQEMIKRHALIGKLVYDKTEECGVRFDRDMRGNLEPIMSYDIEPKPGMVGAFVMYENPPTFKPNNLYWVVYDPAAQDGPGTSFHSVLVYKYYHGAKDGTKYDTIVGEWIGRYDTLEQNYDMVLRIAKFFNARIFPEVNVAGFVSWMASNGHYKMLEGDAKTLEKEINPNGTRNVYNKGVRIDKRKKNWALHKARSWLMEEKAKDPVTGLTSARTINWIMSTRLLTEIVAYNDTGNFDHVSSLVVLMILLAKLEGMDAVEIKDPWDDYKYEGIAADYVIPEVSYVTNKRCSLMNY